MNIIELANKKGYKSYFRKEQVLYSKEELIMEFTLLISWIRENFDISIDVASYYNPQRLDKRMYEIGISHKDNAFEGLMQNAINRLGVDWTTNPNKYWIFDKPEEAIEAALLYTLNNLI